MLFQGQAVTALPKSRTTGNPNAQQLWLGEMGVSEVMPRYSALTKSGFSFSARGALQTLSVAGTAMTGLVVWNGSSVTGGVDLHLLKTSGNIAVTSATTTGIAIAKFTVQPSAPTGTTAATPSNGYLGAAVGSGLAYTVATLASTPTPIFDLLHNTAAIAASGEDAGFLIDLEGLVICPPQTGICFVALGASSAAAAVNLSLMWAELPV